MILGCSEGIYLFEAKTAGVLGERADDLTKEVVSSIDEGCSKPGIYRSDDQFLVVCDLLGNRFIDFDPFLLAKSLGGAFCMA